MERRSVEVWLKNAGLENYVDVFVQQEIEFDQLDQLDDLDLRDLGLKLGPIKKFRKAISTPVAAPQSSVSVHGFDSRKQTTVLRYDIVNHSHLLDLLDNDPEPFRELREQIRVHCHEVLTACHGFRYEIEGDAAYYLFGWPQSIGNPAYNAALASLDLIDSLAMVDAEIPDNWSLKLRVSIATSLMSISLSSANADVDAASRSLGLAARMQSHTDPNTVTIDRRTRDLLGDAFQIRDMGRLPLKSFSETRLFQLLEPNAGLTVFDTSRTGHRAPLMGRDKCLDTLQAVWERARDGAGSCVVVRGPAGIGKSHLCSVLCEKTVQTHAADAGASPIATKKFQCLELRRLTALFPFLERLRFEAQVSSRDSRAIIRRKLEKLLGKADGLGKTDLEILSDALAFNEATYAVNRRLSSEAFREQIMHSIERWITADVEQTPMVLWFEDTHWIDPTSAELLQNFFRKAQDRPVLILLTERNEEKEATRTIFAEDETGVTWIDLDCPDYDASAHIIRHALGEHSTEELVQSIIKRAGPDLRPLWLEEVARFVGSEIGRMSAAFNRQQHYVLDDLPIPENLDHILAEQLDRYGNAQRTLVNVAAVIGERFTEELLGDLCGLDHREFKRSFGRLLNSKTLVRDGVGSLATYSFRHDLIRQAAYEAIATRVRDKLHRKIASLLLNKFTQIVESAPELVAQHLAKAGQVEEAILYWRLASERSASNSAAVEAYSHFKQARALIDRLPEGSKVEETELALLSVCSSVEFACGGYSAPESRAIYDRFLELAVKLGRADAEFAASLGLAASLYVNGDLPGATKKAERCLEMARISAKPHQLLHSNRIMGEILFNAGKFESSLQHLQVSSQLYKPEDHKALLSGLADDPQVLSLLHQALANWFLGNQEVSFRQADNALSLAHRLEHKYTLAQAYFYRSWLSALGRDHGRAEQFAIQAISLCDSDVFDTYEGCAEVILGWVKCWRGDTSAGLSKIETGLTRLGEPEADICVGCFLPFLAEAQLFAGQLNKAAETICRARDERIDGFYCAERRRIEGDIWALLDIDKAHSCYAEALELAESQNSLSLQLRTAISTCDLAGSEKAGHSSYDKLAAILVHFPEKAKEPDVVRGRALMRGGQHREAKCGVKA